MDGDNQKLGQDDGPAVSHNPLSPDEPVSLRLPELPAPETTADYPGPAGPTAAAAQPVPVTPVAPAAAVLSPQPAAPQPSPVSAYALDDEEDDDTPAQQDTTELEWTAAEFIAHPKGMGWYAALAGVTIVVVVLAYLIAHDYVTVAVVIICAGLFGYAAGRQPRELQYALSTTGITIGPKFYPYKDFSSFAIVPEGDSSSSIDFMPLKRFSPILSVSYNPAHEPNVMEILSSHLPVTHHKRTAIDDFMHRIHF